MKRHQGYTLLELIIAVVIVGFVILTVSANIGSALLGIKIENVAADMAAAVYTAERAAASGKTNSQQRTFFLDKADVKPHSGVVVSTQPITEGQNNCGSCPTNQSLICISGQSYCYSPAPNFAFDQFSGALPEAHVIFILSKNRKLALLIQGNGNYTLAELIGGQWRSTTDLQQLLPVKPKNSVPSKG